MLAESALFLYVAYHTDSLSAVKLDRQVDTNFDESVLNDLDEDVIAERERTLGTSKGADGPPQVPLRIDRLRKVFPPKRANGSPVVACQDVAFSVKSGEIFGLLGANGAGKKSVVYFSSSGR